MSCVRVGWVGKVQYTELEPFLGPVLVRIIQFFGNFSSRHAMPGAIIIGILPIVEEILAEFVRIRITVKEGIAIITAKGEILSFGAQLGISLGG
ncbi:hypothetical protein D3C81_958730 [compost metagenome]